MDNSREKALEGAVGYLARCVTAIDMHLRSNGEAVVGGDGRQRVTLGAITADHACVQAVEEARAYLAGLGLVIDKPRTAKRFVLKDWMKHMAVAAEGLPVTPADCVDLEGQG